MSANLADLMIPTVGNPELGGSRPLWAPAALDAFPQKSLRVALRPQPLDLAVACKPLVNLGFALESVHVLGFDAGALGLDLPIALRNSLRFKGDPRRFCHQGNMRENHRDG
jgi:hypothetical protein